MKSLFVAILVLVGWGVHAQRPPAGVGPDAAYIHRAIKQVTDVMVYDIYSPPVAGRTYAYISIAGYEAAVAAHPQYRSLAGQLRGLKALPKPGGPYHATLAAVQAILTVGKGMVVSESKIETFKAALLAEIKAGGIPAAVYQRSVQYGDAVARNILAWAATDNYRETRSFARLAVTGNAASWRPTPPAYLKAVEPNWNKIRPFLLDSAQQFKPPPPTPFATDTASRFYKEALEVRNAALQLTEAQKLIANFWDCNPFKMNVNGHVMYASKKISPGGHWINITALACRQAGKDVPASLEAYATVAIAISDAFISCWDEKYRSNVIRPETYINQYIDAAWMPLLQTPPFPEYTSGHSVVSTACARLLTQFFGEGFVFADSTEMEFGLPMRQFASFNKAAEEAAISRFYGGIHYMPSIINGTTEGRRIGDFVLQKLQLRKAAVAAR